MSTWEIMSFLVYLYYFYVHFGFRVPLFKNPSRSLDFIRKKNHPMYSYIILKSQISSVVESHLLNYYKNLKISQKKWLSLWIFFLSPRQILAVLCPSCTCFVRHKAIAMHSLKVVDLQKFIDRRSWLVG